MKDIYRPIFTSFSGGIVPSSLKHIFSIRLAIYFLCCIIYFFPLFFHFSLVLKILFSLAISLTIFVIRLIFWQISKTISKPVEREETNSFVINMDNINQNYISNPQINSNSNLSFSFSKNLINHDPLSLITSGYDPDAISEFYSAFDEANKSFIDPQPNTSHKLFEKWDYFRLTAIFPFSGSLSYIIFGSVCIFIDTYFISCLNDPDNGHPLFLFEIIIMSVILGQIIYSFFSPPEIEPYSTTQSDNATGLSRMYYIFIAFIPWNVTKFIAKKVEYTIFADIKFHWPIIANYCYYGAKWSVILLPIAVIFAINDPISITIWICDNISRYFFGTAGSNSLPRSFFNLFRNGFAFALNFFAFHYGHRQIGFQSATLLLISITLLIVQIPYPTKEKHGGHINEIHFSVPTNSLDFFRYFVQMFVLIVISLTGSVMPFFIPKSKIFITEWILIVILIILQIILPIFFSNSHYFLFHFRLFRPFKTFSLIKLILTTFICSFIFMLFVKEDQIYDPPRTRTLEFGIFFSMLIVHYFARHILEPHIIALALFIANTLLRYDVKIKHRTASLFLALLIAKKFVSFYHIMEFWRKSRSPRFIPVSDDLETMGPLSILISKLYFSFPLFDKSTKLIPVLWSFILGSPVFSLELFNLVFLPLCPRPNLFYSKSTPTHNAFTESLTEHSVEAPVYASLAKSLRKSFASLLFSGRLGIVGENEFFLLFDYNMSAFVHIISIEPHSVTFQIRGLEYENETVCHHTELSFLQNASSQYKTKLSIPDGLNLEAAALAEYSDWSFKAFGIPIDSYSISKVSLQNIAAGINGDDLEKWLAISFVYTASCIGNVSEKIVFDEINSNEIDSPFSPDSSLKKAADRLGLSIDNSLNGPWRSLISYCELKRRNWIVVFQKLIRINQPAEDGNPYVNIKNNQLLKETSKKALSLLSLASFQLAPDLNDDNLISFVRETEKEYAVVSKYEPESFKFLFDDGSKGIIACFDNNIIFLRRITNVWSAISVDREFVRCFWASDTFDQLLLSENQSERFSIQADRYQLHNLILQACDLPIGYPAYVSPTITSYVIHPSFMLFEYQQN